MYERLFRNQDTLDHKSLLAHAQAVGLEMARFEQALDTQRFRAMVEDDARVAAAAGLNGTPRPGGSFLKIPKALR